MLKFGRGAWWEGRHALRIVTKGGSRTKYGLCVK